MTTLHGPSGEPIASFEDWAAIFQSSRKARHWREGRSAHALADFVCHREGLAHHAEAVEDA